MADGMSCERGDCPFFSGFKKTYPRDKTEYVFDYLFVTEESLCPFCYDYKTPNEICGKCISKVQGVCMKDFVNTGMGSVAMCSSCRGEKDHPVCKHCLAECKKVNTRNRLIQCLREQSLEKNIPYYRKDLTRDNRPCLF